MGGSSKGSKEFGKDELNPLTSLETKVQSLREVIWWKKDVHQNIIPFDTNLWFLKDMNSEPMHQALYHILTIGDLSQTIHIQKQSTF